MSAEPSDLDVVASRRAVPVGKRRPSELRVALITLVLPLYVSVGFAANFIGALHSPQPHHVKVAVVGAPAATTRLARGLSVKARGGLDVSQLRTVGQARRLVADRDLAGGYVPGQHPTAIVASAASASLASFVEATFRELAAAQDRPLAVEDVRPLPAENSSGTPNFFFIIICTLGTFLTVLALGSLAPTLPEPHRIAIVAAASVLAPLIAYLIGGPGYHTFSGDLGTVMAMLGMGALYAFAVAAITRLLQLGLGLLGALVASLLFIFLNFPSTGGAVAPQLMPGFWRFLNHFWIGAAGLDANRSVLYFHGGGVGTDVLKILAWIAAWAALLAIPIYLKTTRRKTTATTALSAQTG
ncbi:MAG TPA: hypothetical protein VMA77_08990 [Solirubrobacteraceae bacterium]|nr:hypothetical protein [Solirubrobacteraceae bacterium]